MYRNLMLTARRVHNDRFFIHIARTDRRGQCERDLLVNKSEITNSLFFRALELYFCVRTIVSVGNPHFRSP